MKIGEWIEKRKQELDLSERYIFPDTPYRRTEILELEAAISSGEIHAGVEWIPVSKKPEYIKSLDESKEILILDGREDKESGKYHNGEFEYWFGESCNTDYPDSQKKITHWAVINLPEEK